MVLELQSYKFHLILQKIYNSKAAFLTLLTADNPYRLCRPHRGKTCAPEAPAHAKPARFSAGACPGNALPWNCHRHTATHTFPCDINIHHHCIFMYRRLSALYSVIILSHPAAIILQKDTDREWGEGRKALKKANPEAPGKFFQHFFRKNLHVLKKVSTFASLLRNNPAAKSRKAHPLKRQRWKRVFRQHTIGV